MSYDLTWSKLDPAEFEEFVYWLVTALGYSEPRWVSGSGDGGVDVVAYFPSSMPGLPLTPRKVVFQCKHIKKLTKPKIEEELANFATADLDTWVLVATSDPSPQLRTWFSNIGNSRRYPFNVEAWWRQDLDRIVRENAEKLLNYLPKHLRVLSGISSPPAEVHSATLTAVTARLRDINSTQIDRFARSKYIPNLYVRRGIQRQIEEFLLDEATVAHVTKTKLINIIQNAQKLAKSSPAGFAKSFREDPKADTKVREAERRRAVQAFRKHVASESEAWLEEFRGCLSDLLTLAKQLPDRTYLAAKHDYERLKASIQNCIRIQRTIPRFSEPVDVLPHAPTGRYDAVKVSIFSEGSSGTEIQALIESALSVSEGLFKPGLLVIDRAGSGKTNLLCHVVTRLSEQQPVILLFGRQPSSSEAFLVDEVQRWIENGFGEHNPNLVATLDALLSKHGQFLTVFIDGINENRDLRI
ncbi:MAG TPA: restriction endonuclease, partial [Longimicrobium sp.]|nr:restriction endonuclease [Longimicrobium sp.]